MSKICIKCGKEKELELFCKNENRNLWHLLPDELWLI